MAMVSSPTAQESEVIFPKPERGVSVQRALLYPPLNLRRKQYQLEWTLYKSMWAIPSESTAVILRDVQKDLWPPKQLYLLTCTRPIWAQNCDVHHVPAPFSTLMPSIIMASGCILLGLQIQFKSSAFPFVMTQLVSLGSDTRVYT